MEEEKPPKIIKKYKKSPRRKKSILENTKSITKAKRLWSSTYSAIIEFKRKFKITNSEFRNDIPWRQYDSCELEISEDDSINTFGITIDLDDIPEVVEILMNFFNKNKHYL